MNIRTRLTILAVVFSTAILGVLIGFVTVRARSELLQTALQSIEQSAVTTAHDIERWEEVIVAGTTAIANQTAFRQMDFEVQTDALAGAFAALDRYVYTMYTIDREGVQFALHTGGRGSGQRGDRIYFRQAIAGAAIARQVLLGRSLDPPAPAVAYGLPIFEPDRTDRVAGVLLAAVRLAELSNIIANNVPQDARAFVVSETGVLIAHTDLELVDGGELRSYWEHPAVAAYLESRQAGQEIRSAAGETTQTRLSRLHEYDDADGHWFAFAVEADNNWIVFVEIDERIVTAEVNTFTTVGIILAAIGAVLIALAIGTVTRVTLKPLNELGVRIESYSHGGGDLTAHLAVQRRDECGQVAESFNEFVAELRDIVASIRVALREANSQKAAAMASSEETAASVDQIAATMQSIRNQIARLDGDAQDSAAASDEIARSSTELKGIIADQVTSVEQSSAAVEQIVASIHNVADTAQSKQEGLAELQTVTERGRDEVKATTDRVDELTGSLGKLQEVVTVINRIASQTNILSMNAAIEAAHAGDSGRGFAVVANEIRGLAESAGVNAKEISQILKKNASDIRELKAFADGVAAHYVAIEQQIGNTRVAFEEITRATGELSTGAESIGEAITVLHNRMQSVSEGSDRIAERSGQIAERNSRVRSISAESLEGMTEISAGTSEISSAMQHLNDAVTRLSEAIGTVDDRLAQFKTDA